MRLRCGALSLDVIAALVVTSLLRAQAPTSILSTAGLRRSAATATPAARAPAAIPQPSQRQEVQDSLEHGTPLFVSVGRR
jgi:hypothetical protein